MDPMFSKIYKCIVKTRVYRVHIIIIIIHFAVSIF